MDQARIVGEVHALGQLDGDIIDHLDVGSGDIDCQVQVQALDVLENVSTIIGLSHREVCTANVIGETVECSHDIGMRLQIDPSSDVLVVWYLPDNKLLSEVLMIDHIRCIADHMLNLIGDKTHK